MKLKDFYENKDLMEGYVGFSMAYLDNIFSLLQKNKIKEVTVDFEEMGMIVIWVGNNCGQTLYGSDALRTGKVDEFFGIKIKLE